MRCRARRRPLEILFRTKKPDRIFDHNIRIRSTGSTAAAAKNLTAYTRSGSPAGDSRILSHSLSLPFFLSLLLLLLFFIHIIIIARRIVMDYGFVRVCAMCAHAHSHTTLILKYRTFSRPLTNNTIFKRRCLPHSH